MPSTTPSCSVSCAPCHPFNSFTHPVPSLAQLQSFLRCSGLFSRTRPGSSPAPSLLKSPPNRVEAPGSRGVDSAASCCVLTPTCSPYCPATNRPTSSGPSQTAPFRRLCPPPAYTWPVPDRPVRAVTVPFPSGARCTTLKSLFTCTAAVRWAAPSTQTPSSDPSGPASSEVASCRVLCPPCSGRAVSPQSKEWSWDDSQSELRG